MSRFDDEERPSFFGLLVDFLISIFPLLVIFFIFIGPCMSMLAIGSLKNIYEPAQFMLVDKRWSAVTVIQKQALVQKSGPNHPLVNAVEIEEVKNGYKYKVVEWVDVERLTNVQNSEKPIEFLSETEIQLRAKTPLDDSSIRIQKKEVLYQLVLNDGKHEHIANTTKEHWESLTIGNAVAGSQNIFGDIKINKGK